MSPNISLLWPVSGSITQYFGENPSMYSKWGYPGHNGVDFGIWDGTPVKAAAAGTVEKVGFEDGGYGNYVKLRHDGFFTYYAHLQGSAVSPGNKVQAGQVIAWSNNTGASTGPHLHFGLRITGKNPAYKDYVDPMPYLTGVTPTPPEPTPPGPTPPGPTPPGPTPPGPTPPGPAPVEIWPGAFDFTMPFKVVGDVNLRSGPGINLPQIGQLKAGDQFTSRRLLLPSAWVEIEPGKWVAWGFTGYVFLELVPELIPPQAPVALAAEPKKRRAKSKKKPKASPPAQPKDEAGTPEEYQ